MGWWKKILMDAQDGDVQAQKIIDEFNKQRKTIKKSHISKELLSKIEMELDRDLDETCTDNYKDWQGRVLSNPSARLGGLLSRAVSEIRDMCNDDQELEKITTDFREWLEAKVQESATTAKNVREESKSEDEILRG